MDIRGLGASSSASSGRRRHQAAGSSVPAGPPRSRRLRPIRGYARRAGQVVPRTPEGRREACPRRGPPRVAGLDDPDRRTCGRERGDDSRAACASGSSPRSTSRCAVGQQHRPAGVALPRRPQDRQRGSVPCASISEVTVSAPPRSCAPARPAPPSVPRTSARARVGTVDHLPDRPALRGEPGHRCTASLPARAAATRAVRVGDDDDDRRARRRTRRCPRGDGPGAAPACRRGRPRGSRTG